MTVDSPADITFLVDVNLRANQTWTVNGTTTLTANSQIRGGGSTLTKAGTGILTLGDASTGSSNNNTYTGLTTVNAGTLNLNKTAGSNAIAGDLTISGGSTVLQAADQIADTSTVTVNNPGILDLNDNDESFDALAGTGDVMLGSGTLTVGANGGGGSFTGVISETGGVTKTGAGTQALGGANTYTGTTTVAGGVLQVDAADGVGNGALGNAGEITFTGGTLQYTANSAGTDYALRIRNSTSAVTLDTNGQNVTLARAISNTNSGGLTKEGTGTLTLSAASAYGGATTVNNGTLATGTANVIPDGVGAGNVTVNGPGTLNLNNGGDTINGLNGDGTVEITGATNRQIAVGAGNADATFSGTIRDTGTGGLLLIKVGTGTQTFSGVVAHERGTSISPSGGTLRFDTGGALGLVGGVNLQGGTLQLASGTLTTVLTRNAGDASATFQVDSGASATVTGNIGFGGSRTLVLDSDGTNTGTGLISASLASGFGSGNLQVDGGTWTLSSNANNMTGDYTINDGGILIVSGTLGANATQGVDDVVVNAGGMLKGGGTIGNALRTASSLTINSGGAIAPGNSIGTMTVNMDTTWNGGSFFEFEFDDLGDSPNGGGAAGTNWDQLVIDGTLDLVSLSVGTPVTINLIAGAIGGWDSTGGLNGEYAWTFVTTTGGITGFNKEHFAIDTMSFDSANTIDMTNPYGFVVKQQGNNLVLFYTAVPEPGTVGVLVALFSGLALRRRRRQLV